VVAWRQNWAEDRVYFEDERKKLRSLPSRWTSLVSDDPALVVAAGRAHFRVADLVPSIYLNDSIAPCREGSEFGAFSVSKLGKTGELCWTSESR
jgi:hypothetical protein